VDGRDGGKEVKERLALFDKLRLPRCNLTMLVSNGGPNWMADPAQIKEIRRFYDGWLPEKEANAWFKEMRSVMFDYDVFKETEAAMAGKGKGEGAERGI
jgi:salicylate hydroxylase